MDAIFYYYPVTCSTASHIILEESGLPYQRQLVDLNDGKHRSTSYMDINPKGAVPAISFADKILTENQAILTYVADQVPDKQLIAAIGSDQRYRMHEWMNYCAASLHPYVRSVFRPAAFVGDDTNAAKSVKAVGLKMMAAACNIVESKLTNNNWAVGNQFSVVDAYLFIMYIWSRDPRMGIMPECPKWTALAKRVNERPCTKKILQIELEDRPEVQLPF